MELVDGKKLSQKILDGLKEEISGIGRKLRLAVVIVGKNDVIEKFVAQKKEAAVFLGADIKIYHFEEKITTNELRKRIAEIVHEKLNSGVIIQLPMPAHINAQYILNSVTPEKDVDMLSSRAVGNFATGKSEIFPPVVGAVKAIFEEYKIDYKNKNIVVVGAGVLVGRPLAIWFLNEKATLSVIRSVTPNPEEFLKKADIIITGVGKPKFITGDMIKNGAIVIDAGTSELEGEVSGDVDFDSVSKKASVITPVPGGVGPVTVAVLFKNLIILSREK